MPLASDGRGDGCEEERPLELWGVLTWPTKKEWGAMINIKSLGEIAEDRFYVIATTILLFLAVIAACSLAIAQVPTAQATSIMAPIMGFVALLIYQYRSNFTVRQKTAETQKEVHAVREEVASNREVAKETAAAVKSRLDQVNSEQFSVLEEIREAGQRTLQLVDLHQQGCLATLARVTQTMASLTMDPEDQRIADAAHKEWQEYLLKAEKIKQAVERRRSRQLSRGGVNPGETIQDRVDKRMEDLRIQDRDNPECSTSCDF